MKILVTGGAGFIGSHLVDKLIESGHQVAVVDNLSSGRLSNLNGYAKFHNIAVEDKKLNEVFRDEQPEIVYHLASQISVSNSFEDAALDSNSNIIGTINVLDNCKKYGIKKIIYFSSAAVYGDQSELPVKEEVKLNPGSPYAISKFTAEKYIQLYANEYGLKYSILRPANVYGPRQTTEGEAGVIAIFIDKLLKGEQPTIFGDGSMTRDFIYVDDVVNANLGLLNSEKSDVYNISTNTETTIKDLYYKIKNLIGSDLGPIYDQPRKEIIKSRLCNDKLCQDTQGGATAPSVHHSLDQGLEKTIEHYKNLKINEGVWLIVPAYNVEKIIGQVLKSLQGVAHNIVVIDDDSTDETARICQEYRCHFLHHPVNYGQGAALQTGMDYALKMGAKILVHFDGDGQMQVKDIASLTAPIINGECDAVFGSRYLAKGKNKVPFSKKWFIHKPAILINWLTTNVKLSDAHCGFRALSARAAGKICIRQNRMAHASEIPELIKEAGLKYKEAQVDILYNHYGQNFHKSLKILKELFKFKATKA